MIAIPNIYFLHKEMVLLAFGWNATPKIAQSNTLLINNITFNMVNNSRNALCILSTVCGAAAATATATQDTKQAPKHREKHEGDTRQTIE